MDSVRVGAAHYIIIKLGMPCVKLVPGGGHHPQEPTADRIHRRLPLAPVKPLNSLCKKYNQQGPQSSVRQLCLHLRNIHGGEKRAPLLAIQRTRSDLKPN